MQAGEWIPLAIGLVIVWLITIGVCRTRLRTEYVEHVVTEVPCDLLEYSNRISDIYMETARDAKGELEWIAGQVKWVIANEVMKYISLEVYREENMFCHVVKGRLYVGRPTTSTM